MRRVLPDGFELDDDRDRVDVDVVYRYLSEEAYWVPGRSRATIEEQIRSSTRVIAAYELDGALVGFCRVISDGSVRQLTREFDPRFVIAVPHWSPRGDLINFLSNRNTGTPQTSLWVVTPDGGVARDLGVMGVGADPHRTLVRPPPEPA